jgi:YD repeat-containing protein
VIFQAGSFGTTAKMWVNEVAVFKGTTLTISGISEGARVRLLSPTTGEPLVPDAIISYGSAVATLNPSFFPRMTVQILDREWTPIYTSPFREFWGGTAFNFVEPQFIAGLKKTSSGFMRNLKGIWVDDDTGTPPSGGTLTKDGESWVWRYWPPDSLVLSGTAYHYSLPAHGRHGHGFHMDSQGWAGPLSDEFNVQFAYLTPDALSAEILRAFESHYDGTWKHRAIWGAPDLDGLGGTNGTNARRWMGFLPLQFNRWTMLIVRQSDIGSGADTWKGSSYYAVGGGVRWDVSAIGYPTMGQIKVIGLPASAWVNIRDVNGNTKGSAQASASGEAMISLYGTGDSFKNAFPITARFSIDAPGRVYDSPWFENVFGGDTFQWSGTNFYVNSQLSSRIKDRLAGAYQVQSGSVVVESYMRYEANGNLWETKAKGPTSWVTSSRTHDSYGNLATVSALYDDTHFHQTSYTHGALSGSALSQVSDGAFGSTTFGYNPTTGERTSVTPPKLQGTGKATSYVYDAVGRVTRITHPDQTFVTREYYDLGKLVVIKDENYNEAAGRKRQTWECYDAIGRLTSVRRFDDGGPLYSLSCSTQGYYSIESYTYDWRDNVVLRTSPTGSRFQKTFDFLGRPSRITNPDGTYVDISYGVGFDDTFHTKTVTVTTDVQSARQAQYDYD